MITKLRLTALADDRSNYRPCVILKKLVGYKVTLCCVDDDIIYVKLLGKPYRREYIVCPVGVEMCGYLVL